MIRILAPAVLAPLLLLAACTDEPVSVQEGEPAPMGEVLEGSISDEMIAYDRLRSQPPLAAPLPSAGTAPGQSAGTGPEAAPVASGESEESGGASPVQDTPIVQVPPPIPEE